MRPVVCILFALFCLAGCTAAGFLSPGSESAGTSLDLAPQGKAARAITVPTAQGGLLIRGTEPVRGLPGFGRNAIPALAGTYLVQSREGRPPVTVPVWASWERLFFKPPLWTAESPPGGEVLRVWRQELGPTTGVLRAYELKSTGPGASPWTLLVLEPPVRTEDPVLMGLFYRNLISRFIYFLENARRAEDVSLPALVGI